MQYVELKHVTLDTAFERFCEALDSGVKNISDLHSRIYRKSDPIREKPIQFLNQTTSVIDDDGNEVIGTYIYDLTENGVYEELFRKADPKKANLFNNYLLRRSLPYEYERVNESWLKKPEWIPGTASAIACYFAKQRKFSPMLTSVAMDRVKHLSPSRVPIEELKAVVAIPVSASQEHETLPKTLDLLRSQTLSSGQFEVMLYLNETIEPREEELGTFYKAKELELTMHDYCADNPDFQFRWFFDTYFGKHNPPISEIRSTLADVIGADLLERGVRDRHNIAYIHLDADSVNLSPGYIEGLTKALQDNKTLISTGILNWQPLPGIGSDSKANKLLAYGSILGQMANNNENGLNHTPEAATAISVNALFGAGGYIPFQKLGEVIGITNNIRALTNKRSEDGNLTFEGLTRKADPVKVVPGSVLTTNSRRKGLAMLRGVCPTEAWRSEKMPFLARDPARTIPLTEIAVQAEQQAQTYYSDWAAQMTLDYLGHHRKESVLDQTYTIRTQLGLV